MTAPKPVTQAARFVSWGASYTPQGSCLTMTVVPETQEKTPITVNIPVAKKDNGAVEPPDSVKSLAGQLRVGDELELTYVKSGTTLKYSEASAKGGGSPASDDAAVFTFSARRMVPFRGKQVEAMVVGRGPMTWTFLLPDADPKDDAYQPDAELLKKVKECRRGNRVRLTYDPADFVFWLRGIEIVRAPDDKKGQGASPGAEKRAQNTAPGAEKKAPDSGAGGPVPPPVPGGGTTTGQGSAPASPAVKT